MNVELAWIAALFVLTEVFGVSMAPTEHDRLEWALHAYDWEPGVRRVQEAATRNADFAPDATASMRGRARWRGLLPEGVEGRYTLNDGLTDRFSTNEDLDGDLQVLDTETTTARSQDVGGRWYLGARWDLRGLVFDPEEIDVERLATKTAENRIELELTVTRTYHERRRVQIELLLNPPHDADEGAARHLELQRLTSQLDALTGGWFGAEIERRRRGLRSSQ
jgi:hypothetical protein